MRRIVSLVAALSLGASTSLTAQSLFFETKDEMDGNLEHAIYVHGDNYKSHTNEEKLSFSCRVTPSQYTPPGYIFTNWHKGGRYSGRWGYGMYGIRYKLDDKPVKKISFGEESNKVDERRRQVAIKKMMREMANSSVLLLKMDSNYGGYTGSADKFPLTTSYYSFAEAYDKLHPACKLSSP